MKRQISETNKLRQLLRDRRGAGMTEYIILVGVIALLALAAFNVFGGQVRDKIKAQGDTVETKINDETPD
jgi:pilus assembly protein Flp/PilA